MGEAKWYSVTVDVEAAGTWRPLDPPCTQAYEGDAGELIERVVQNYDLDESSGPWRVRVYAGYDRYDELLVERTG